MSDLYEEVRYEVENYFAKKQAEKVVHEDEGSILAEAENIVNGERATDYGDAKESFEKIADFTNMMLSEQDRETIKSAGLTDKVVCKMLMAVKLTRESNKHKRDNLVDLCGYSELLNRLYDV